MEIKRALITCVISLAMCGCTKTNTQVTENSGAVSTVERVQSDTDYMADDFTIIVANHANSALSHPLNVIRVCNENNSNLNMSISETNQRSTYACDDYDLSSGVPCGYKPPRIV